MKSFAGMVVPKYVLTNNGSDWMKEFAEIY
jgi:hypothetical protein